MKRILLVCAVVVMAVCTSLPATAGAAVPHVKANITEPDKCTWEANEVHQINPPWNVETNAWCFLLTDRIGTYACMFDLEYGYFLGVAYAKMRYRQATSSAAQDAGAGPNSSCATSYVDNILNVCVIMTVDGVGSKNCQDGPSSYGSWGDQAALACPPGAVISAQYEPGIVGGSYDTDYLYLLADDISATCP